MTEPNSRELLIAGATLVEVCGAILERAAELAPARCIVEVRVVRGTTKLVGVGAVSYDSGFPPLPVAPFPGGWSVRVSSSSDGMFEYEEMEIWQGAAHRFSERHGPDSTVLTVDGVEVFDDNFTHAIGSLRDAGLPCDFDALGLHPDLLEGLRRTHARQCGGPSACERCAKALATFERLRDEARGRVVERLGDHSVLVGAKLPHVWRQLMARIAFADGRVRSAEMINGLLEALGEDCEGFALDLSDLRLVGMGLGEEIGAAVDWPKLTKSSGWIVMLDDGVRVSVWCEGAVLWSVATDAALDEAARLVATRPLLGHFFGSTLGGRSYLEGYEEPLEAASSAGAEPDDMPF